MPTFLDIVLIGFVLYIWHRFMTHLRGQARRQPETQAEISARVYANRPGNTYDQKVRYKIGRGKVSKISKASIRRRKA